MVAALVGLALVAALVASAILMRRWRIEQAEARRVRATFARYVAPSIVDELLNRKDERIFTGREIHATILVARIWNFSQFIENLTPEETLRYLNEFYAMAGSSIERHKGVLHRFLDDGVVGIFGVPLEDPFQEDHALRSAINIVRLVNVMQERWVRQNRKPLRVGVGINSGNVIAGDAGFAHRREYTVVGPNVALAHRLQAATSELNAFIVASRATADSVRELYNFVPVSGVPLNGVRALLDASIVRGRKGGDSLNLPRADAFAKTILEETLLEFPEPPPSAYEDMPSVAYTPFEPDPVVPPPTPPPEPAPPLRTRPTARPTMEPAPARGFDNIPELQIPSFGHDAEPIMPDVQPRATYEDRDGPPHPI